MNIFYKALVLSENEIKYRKNIIRDEKILIDKLESVKRELLDEICNHNYIKIGEGSTMYGAIEHHYICTICKDLLRVEKQDCPCDTYINSNNQKLFKRRFCVNCQKHGIHK